MSKCLIRGSNRFMQRQNSSLKPRSPAPTRRNQMSAAKSSYRPPVSASRSFGEVVRTRRSALDFRGGDESMSLAQLATLLASTGKPLLRRFRHPTFRPTVSLRPSSRKSATRRLSLLAGARGVGKYQAGRPAAGSRGAKPWARPGRKRLCRIFHGRRFRKRYTNLRRPRISIRSFRSRRYRPTNVSCRRSSWSSRNRHRRLLR